MLNGARKHILPAANLNGPTDTEYCGYYKNAQRTISLTVHYCYVRIILSACLRVHACVYVNNVCACMRVCQQCVCMHACMSTMCVHACMYVNNVSACMCVCQQCVCMHVCQQCVCMHACMSTMCVLVHVGGSVQVSVDVNCHPRLCSLCQ